MNFNIQNHCQNADWERVAGLMAHFGITEAPPETHKKAFEQSYAVTFVYDQGRLIGFGRAVSDGVSQAVLYNIVVDPDYHGQGLGRAIIEDLLKAVGHCDVILYTHPDKMSFYTHLGFRRMRTGMALYLEEGKKEEMEFIE
ncbi:ribosomal protein S18 acetylase RimI-like enzyme [Paenibacillus forsythiae]|uniref:Ribosomal protein S18 acetylase RimI-like enzyme n=1 Tax=Paenibacillus forsythiae TaxID=365616 RepID=A0ABU3H2I0_9BACL|nr:GNAT family N-acetyltransferase [Paenibacillus forsythiae]MDT3425021.1 ribosomal protein S18 acetylase RimI-like enzyme [Paenibacillus forsythiae]